MSWKTWIYALLLLDFLALTGYALVDAGGIVPMFAWQLSTVTGWQVMVDLVLMLGVAAVLIHNDARRLGIAPWPWIASLLLGSPGALAYMIRREVALRAPGEAPRPEVAVS